MNRRFLALAGGVGGARLAAGLAGVLAPEDLTVVVNTGDDFEHLGLAISPDLDTVMYTLAGINNPEQGWGINGESWAAMDALKRLGGEDWFQLGDRDLATHILRTRRLRDGESLSAVTTDLCQRLGIRHPVVPMSDAPVRTMVTTDEGVLAFQHYFVRRRCEPRFEAIDFAGAETAGPSEAFAAALDDPALAAILICPSNPVLSIRPILNLPGVEARLRERSVPIVAVSPFIGGKAVKGPAAKIFAELRLETTPAGLIESYDGLLDGLVIDRQDAGTTSALPCLATDTLMRNSDDQQRLARETIQFALTLAS